MPLDPGSQLSGHWKRCWYYTMNLELLLVAVRGSNKNISPKEMMVGPQESQFERWSVSAMHLFNMRNVPQKVTFGAESKLP